MRKSYFSIPAIIIIVLFSMSCNKKSTEPEPLLAAPILLSPANDTTLTTVVPTLQWNPVETAGMYDVVVDNLNNFDSPEFSKMDVDETSCMTDTLPVGMNYWKVRAKNGEWSDAWHFTIDTTGPNAPTLIEPLNGTVIVYYRTPTFDWSDADDALSYELIVDDSNTFSSPELHKIDLSISRYTTTEALSDGTYFWRIRAKDAYGNTGEWSSIWDFKICFHETDTMIDQDGNVYKTVKIGIDWWMAENLRVTHYRNGNEILKTTSVSEWFDLLISYPKVGACCAYNNNEANAEIYGYLYNLRAVTDSRNIAPEGWHYPSDIEWKRLEMHIGMSRSEVILEGWRGTDQGDKLKATSGWVEDGNGTNESGFNALPGGMCFFDGLFYNMGEEANFWVSQDIHSGLYRSLSYESSQIFKWSHSIDNGYSVRLVKD